MSIKSTLAVAMTALLVPTVALALSLPSRNTGSGVSVNDIYLAWTAPSSREDGTALALTEIAGYEIAALCTSTTGVFLDTLIPAAAGATSYDLMDNAAGVCEFAISTVDTTGLQSVWSDVVSITIEPSSGPKKIQLFLNQKIVQSVIKPVGKETKH